TAPTRAPCFHPPDLSLDEQVGLELPPLALVGQMIGLTHQLTGHRPGGRLLPPRGGLHPSGHHSTHLPQSTAPQELLGALLALAVARDRPPADLHGIVVPPPVSSSTAVDPWTSPGGMRVDVTTTEDQFEQLFEQGPRSTRPPTTGQQRGRRGRNTTRADHPKVVGPARCSS